MHGCKGKIYAATETIEAKSINASKLIEQLKALRVFVVVLLVQFRDTLNEDRMRIEI